MKAVLALHSVLFCQVALLSVENGVLVSVTRSTGNSFKEGTR